ncbi:glycoside hydrolase family 15 protein [Iamia sp.]|uniref:glycoside hydrolase family 15 protein n=1 Tax=Iamia sp. TaxID=2722710 RepID=UPI002CA6751B|nr:glycoside hydrolase family 15 protein [Iamia sp.]HXH58994.1 glycoside hydrolase family 15 protein [Iamia sp.]
MWIPWTLIFLGAWLVLAPFSFGYLNDDLWMLPSGGRGAWFAGTQTYDSLRASLMTGSDVLSGAALAVLGWRALKVDRPVTLGAGCGVGLWLLLAPVVLWAPTPAAFLNDSLVGLFVIALTILIPGMPKHHAGVAVAYDFMAVPADDHGSQLVRIVEARSGDVPFRMVLRASPGFEPGQAGLRAAAGTVVIGNQATVASTAIEPVSVRGDTAVLDTVVTRGRPLVLGLAAPGPAEALTGRVSDQALAARKATERWWRTWLGANQLPGTCRSAVARSALTVKLLHNQPSSALVAAPTTSLPERIGGSRNWDYRYSWLCDSAMMILALQQLSHHDEVMAYWGWLVRAAQRQGADLSIAFTLDGDAIPAEREIGHLSGHRSSRPVRVGNDAGHQRQHDVYGSVMAAASHCYHHMPEMDRAMPERVLQRIADLTARRWDSPDDSIWELRDGRDHHTYSRLMCWVALDRAVDLNHHHALAGDLATWSAQRDAIREQILRRAWNPTLGAFTGTIDGDHLDAAALVVPLVGFLPADDPRCRATRDAVTTQLDDGGLLHRYAYDDGLGEPDNPFLLCTLWLADNHTLDGDPGHGQELLERVLATSNDLGLLGEEANPTSREPLGNFPQGLTHLGVIHSAHYIEAAQ